MGQKIKIKDQRKLDMATGKPMSDRNRMHANINSEDIEGIISAAKKHGVDPYTALAIGLQESGYKEDNMRNPFMLGNYNPQGDVIDESMRFMAEKNKYAKRLGKTTEEDTIQAWNGYGTIKGTGKMYGLDLPLNMKENPVYGKRVINLRDSVIKTNPEIVKLVDKYKDGGPIKKREDFKGSIFKSLIPEKSGGLGKGKYFPDLSNYFQGDNKHEYKYLEQSKYQPSISKDKNIKYISINDDTFKNAVVDIATNPNSPENKKYVEKISKDGSKINIQYHPKLQELGRAVISKGKDEKGEYVSYYDKYDIKNQKLATFLKAGKPFEIYDRIYFNENKKSGGQLNNTPMKNKDLSRYRIIDLYDGSQYDLGGWLGENKNAFTGAGSGILSGASAGTAFGPLGTIAGGLIGGVTGLLGGNNADEVEAQAEAENNRRKRDMMLSMPKTVGTTNMTPNVMSFKRGGGLSSISANKASEMLKNPPHGKKLSKKQKKAFQAIAHGWKPSYENGGDMMNQDLIEVEGPSHEEGGIQFTPDAELEGGETVYNNVVNSDSIKIDKELAEQYGLPKQAIGKTIAEYSKIVNNKYEGRDVDPFAMKSKEIELNNLSQMSMMIAQMAGNKEGEYQNGGNGPLRQMAKKIYDPFVAMYDAMKFKDPNSINQQLYGSAGSSPYETRLEEFDKALWPFGINPENGFDPARIKQNPSNVLPAVKPSINKGRGSNTGATNAFEFSQKPGYQLQDAWMDYAKRNNQTPKLNVPNITNTSLVTSDMNTIRPYSGTKSPISTDTNKSMKGTGEGLTKALGLAPLAIGAFQALRSALDKPEHVNLSRVHYDPMHPEFIDPAYQLRNVEDTFATGNEQMNQVSRKDFLRRRIQSATEEAKTKSGVLGQIQAANTQMLNQSRQQNQQNRMQTNAMNAELGLQEENINAANRGAWQTNRDYQLNNLGTMVGEYARDRKMESADERYRDRWLDVAGNMFGGQKLDPMTLQWENTGTGLVADNNYVYKSNPVSLPALQEKTPVQYEDLEISNPGNYNFYNRNRSLLSPARFNTRKRF